MTNDTPTGGEPGGNKKIITAFIAIGALFLIIFLLFFSGILKQDFSEQGNANAAAANQGRAVP